MAQAIRDADMDVLIYPDVGIDARATLLASMRLAPRQLAGWGHPVTTGLPTIDGFISCASMEPADGADHYREALHLLPGTGTAFFDPGEPAPVARADFDLPQDAHLYLVPHVAPKLHPDCDAVFAQIAASDPRAILLTFRFDRPVVRETIERRLHAALRAAGADPQRQLRVLPYLPRPQFLGLCTLADVMLDTLHWSGGANTVDALRCRLPVVTCPGPFMRGRQTLGMLRSLQLESELACADPQALVARAVAVASDRDLRADLARRIDAAVPILFDGTAALQSLADLVRSQLEA
jgi:CRISPR-associated protein Csy1